MNLIVDAVGEKMKNEHKIAHEQGVYLAYIREYFHRQEKLEHSLLEKMLGKEEKPKTDMDMLLKVHELNAALGGNVG